MSDKTAKFANDLVANDGESEERDGPPKRRVERQSLRVSMYDKDKKKKKKGDAEEEDPELMKSKSASALDNKNARRTRTLGTMGVNNAVMKAMKEAMSTMAINDNSTDQSAEDKLKEIMIAAKQTGMSVDKIFGFFKNSTSDDSDLTPDQFKEALQRLSPGMFDVEDGQLDDLIQKFDSDGDGLVSFPEFRHYCYYNINAVCWRAERLRMEKSGAMQAMEEEYHNVHDKNVPSTHADEIDAHPENVFMEAGDKIYAGNKLFWRNNHTVHTTMWHNVEVSCMSVVCWNETEDHHFPPIFVDSARIPIDKVLLDTKLMQQMSEQAKQKTQSEPETLKQQIMNEMLSSFILARLKVPDSSNPFPRDTLGSTLPPLTPRTEKLMPFLTMLSSDTRNLMIPRPANYIEPPRYKKLAHVDMDKFHGLLSEVNAHNGEMKKMNTNAERMTQLLDISMMAFKNAEKEKQRKKTMSKQKQQWMNSFTTWIVGKQVAQVRLALDKSAAYADLLQQQAERKAAAKERGVTLPPI